MKHNKDEVLKRFKEYLIDTDIKITEYDFFDFMSNYIEFKEREIEYCPYCGKKVITVEINKNEIGTMCSYCEKQYTIKNKENKL